MYSLHSKTPLWIMQMAASHSVFWGWSTTNRPHETGRYRTVLPSCDVETLYGTADTLWLWPDLIRNIRWEACRCDGSHCKDRACGRLCPVGCLRCLLFPPGQVVKGFGGYCLSFPQHFLWLHQVTFGGLWGQEDFKRKSTCSITKFALSATQRLCLHRPLYLLQRHL